jgi:hypothetical protein
MVFDVILLPVLQLCMRARAQNCFVIAVFLTENTLIVLCSLSWEIPVAILLVAVGVWIVLFSL